MVIAAVDVSVHDRGHDLSAERSARRKLLIPCRGVVACVGQRNACGELKTPVAAFEARELTHDDGGAEGLFADLKVHIGVRATHRPRVQVGHLIDTSEYLPKRKNLQEA